MTVALIHRAAAREREAVQLLVQQLTPVIQARAARALLRRQAAAGGRDSRQELTDFTQHVFMVLFADGGRVLLQWRPDGGASFVNFIGMVAEREIASILRSRRRSPWGEEATAAEDLAAISGTVADGEGRAISKDILRQVVARLDGRLSERGIELFQWIVVDDCSVEEVCVLAGMKPDAVYAWRSRLARVLREIAAEIVSDVGDSTRTPPQKVAHDG
jgi:RNA polymerase sigma-70 factor (ECF subfamily)